MKQLKTIDFIGNSKRFYILSGSICILIIACLFIRGINLDIQFKGGLITTYSYDGEIAVEDFQNTVQGVLNEATVKHSRDIVTGSGTMVVEYAGSIDVDTMAELNAALSSAYADNNVKSESSTNVDPVIGKEFLAKSLTAIALASVFMMLYVAFRFRKVGGLSAGAMAVLALLHDIFVVFGVFIIFRLPINDNFIAVVLTILGYSLNDTIVIYDRIRENRVLLGNVDIATNVNTSINQTFVRTIITSVTTVLAMIAVVVLAYINNVDTIVSFAFPMIIGLISGSYSSICIAGPLWVKWRVYRDAKPKRA